MILSTDVTQTAAVAGNKKEPSAKISLVEGSRNELLVRLLQTYSKHCMGVRNELVTGSV